MTRVWIYVLNASKHPDRIDCAVPWLVDQAVIFFGPCKIRMRRQLRWEYLTEDCAYRTVTDDLDDLYIVGVNGSNKEKTRKVVWAGRLSAVMTFAEAYTRLNGTRFRKLRASANSPLHVRPV